MSFKINKTVLAVNSKPYFIADIAANHDGDLQRALALIELAKDAGADAAKFQNFKADKIVSEAGFDSLGNSSHQSKWKKSVFDTYADASVSDEWTPILKAKCDEVGIEYMTSPYDYKSVDWADSFVNAYKIGSGDITWIEMVEYIAKKKKPVILATGASTLDNVEMAMNCVMKYTNDIVLMQCNTNYTASNENLKHINLNVLKVYRQMYPQVVLGLSDHTKGASSVLGAVALGAVVIEKHFTDDRTRNGPDHAFSTTPNEWREMVLSANEVYLALGDGIKRIEDNEAQTAVVQRRGLYLECDVKRGEKLKRSDIAPLRPWSPDGFYAYEFSDVISRIAKNDLKKGQILSKEDIDL